MKPTLTLSRAMLNTFQVCQRRFQLRYLEAVPWPALSLEAEFEKARDLGNRFHMMLNRHFLGLPAREDEDISSELDRWWRLFLEWEPTLPDGRRYPEYTLTTPVGSHFVVGRFDLLIISEGRVDIIDWKTSAKVRTASQLWNDLQTRLYLAIAVEGAEAIGESVDPNNVSLTYWYGNLQAQTVSLRYDVAKHGRFWLDLQELVSEIDTLLVEGKQWPLTTNTSQCELCPYQIICNRQSGSLDLTDWDEGVVDLEVEPKWI